MAKKQKAALMHPGWIVFSWITMTSVALLGAFGFLTSRTTQEISDSYPIFFVPSEFFFSIWGLAYIALGVYAVYAIQPSEKKNKRVRHLDFFYLMVAVTNILWIFMWHSAAPGLSTVALVALLISLVSMYGVTGRVKAKSLVEWWAIDAPISLFTALIWVVSLANLSISLRALGIPQSPITAFLFMIAVALTAQLTLLRRKDYIFALVIIWSLVGMAINFAHIPLLWAGGFGLSLLILGTAAFVYFNLNRPTTRKTLEGDK